MADIGLRDKWLLDAADQSADATAQIAWLREQRKAYSAAIGRGDVFFNQNSMEGSSANAQRNITAKDNHDAIVAALRALGATDLGGGGRLYTPVYGGIQS